MYLFVLSVLSEIIIISVFFFRINDAVSRILEICISYIMSYILFIFVLSLLNNAVFARDHRCSDESAFNGYQFHIIVVLIKNMSIANSLLYIICMQYSK